MKLRIKELRKSLRLSRDDFGKALGVSRDVIANIELGRLARPEQKEPLLRLICEKFNVSYEWITTGEGEMQVVTKQSFIEKLSEEFGLSSTAQKIIECYINLDKQQQAGVDAYLSALAETLNEAEANPPLAVVDRTNEKFKHSQAAVVDKVATD
jgi:transcriptional regulator with XRE-family HTH domain